MAVNRYDFTHDKQEQYKALCTYGIGYNIPYSPVTFDRPINDPKKKFQNPKADKLFKAVMSRDIAHITVEGGKRGGKDVYALYSWANYLMLCPNRLHLATGQTINHAINTILEADGFGIRYLLPHGEKRKIDDRVVFMFMDFYGVIKEIHVFSGGESNDSEKFRGISYGSHYANEAINQHYNTIKEGASRTNASKWRKIIHTQNPLAGEFEYYSKYEKPLIATDDIAKDVYEKRVQLSAEYTKHKGELAKSIEDGRQKILQVYMKKFNLTSPGQIAENQSIYRKYLISLREVDFIMQKAYNEKYRHDYIIFEPYFENPNGVKNGLNFRYFHFTHDDNLSMTDIDREKIEDSYDKTGIVYKREIRGIRASSDNAIWPTLTDKNILRGPIPENSNFLRYLVVDFGMMNAFVVIDCDVEEDYECKIWQEYRFDGREQQEKGGNYVPPTTSFYADKIEEMINSRNKNFNDKYIAVIVDPSATPLINELKIRGINVKKAKNDVGKRREKEKPDKKTDKSIVGIWLVRDGFDKNMIKIHNSCIKGLNECYSYSFDPKKLALGEEIPLKEHDHFPDCVRYLVNTVVKNGGNWNKWQKTK